MKGQMMGSNDGPNRMPNDNLNAKYNVITTWCQNVKSFLFSWEKSLIRCIISIIIRPHSQAYKHIMILLRITSTYDFDFDYDFDIIWYRLTLSWYNIILGSFRPSFPLSSHKITCGSHQSPIILLIRIIMVLNASLWIM